MLHTWFCNLLGRLTQSPTRPAVKKASRPGAIGVETLEDRLAMSSMSVLGASLAGSERAIGTPEVRTALDATYMWTPAKSGHDGAYMWTPAEQSAVGRDDRFFQDVLVEDAATRVEQSAVGRDDPFFHTGR